MKIALDPYMLRSTPLLELPGVVADLGYEFIELSPREDFTPFFLHPRADDATVKSFKKALDRAETGTGDSAAVVVGADEEIGLARGSKEGLRGSVMEMVPWARKSSGSGVATPQSA